MTQSADRFYVIYRQLAELCDAGDTSIVPTVELDEIDEIRRLVLEVSEEQPQFSTST